MAIRKDQEISKSNIETAASPGELLAELRNSQRDMSNDVAVFSSSLVILNDSIATITELLADAQQARTELAAEKLAALNAIQTKLQEAVAVIRAASLAATTPTDPRRLGY